MILLRKPTLHQIVIQVILTHKHAAPYGRTRRAVPDGDVPDDGTTLVWLVALNETAPG